MKVSSLKQMIVEQFRHQKGVVAVLLYGSYAKGNPRPDSDVDIAVLYDKDHVPSTLDLWELRKKLFRALPVDVDLVCLNRTSPIIGSQVYKHHQPLVINDHRKLTEYFIRLMSEYAELKELRRPMEEQILERRRFYGRTR